MNPVHAVLRNCDILRVIIAFLKVEFSWHWTGRRYRYLVDVALVCRDFCDLVLKVLWRDIDMESIYSLFPMDTIRVHPRGRKSLTRIPATQEWERFDIYASWIHELSASPSTNDLFLRGLRTRYPTLHHPFPNLTCLRWTSAPARMVDATILICPTLVRVHFFITDPSVDEDDNVVAEVLRSLGETCPRLRKFEYEHYSTAHYRSKSIETALISFIHQSRRLEEVLLPVSRAILRSLASLPQLSTLVLDHIKWDDGSQLLYPPTQEDEWIEESDRFPVLDDLTIQYSHAVSSLKECFQDSGCSPRESFTMCEIFEREQWSTLTIAEFFRGIMRPDRSEGLQVVCIDRQTDTVNPVVHDPWQALRCLYSIPTLHTLSLDGLFLDIRDTDLEQISRIWPKLHTLSLEVPCCENYQSQISFRGLAHLSTLEDLETVTLMLAPQSTISESMLSPSTLSNSRLKCLKIQGNFPPVTTYEVALFLIFHFPRLERIDTLDCDEQEKARMKEIQVVLDVVRSVTRTICTRSSLNADAQPGLREKAVRISPG